MAVLNETEVEQHLTRLPGWSRQGGVIEKVYAFDGFMAAIDFVKQAAERAESMNHHPDISIQYKNATLTLSTHSEGGTTEKDTNAARAFDALAG